MRATDAVRQIMQGQNVGPSKMADRLGKNSRAISDRLTQTNISIEKLNEMLRVLDYKIVIMPRSNRMQDGMIEIE